MRSSLVSWFKIFFQNGSFSDHFEHVRGDHVTGHDVVPRTRAVHVRVRVLCVAHAPSMHSLHIPYNACAVFVILVAMENEKVIAESDPILGRSGYGVQSPPPPYSEQEKELQKCRVYPGRFYVLMVLAFLALQQNVAWMMFGTIPNESYQHFGLTDDDITIIAGKKIAIHSNSGF